MTHGSRFNGLGLFLMYDSTLNFDYVVGADPTSLSAEDKLTPGKHTITIDLAFHGDATDEQGFVTLTVDDKEVAKGRVPPAIHSEPPGEPGLWLSRRQVLSRTVLFHRQDYMPRCPSRVVFGRIDIVSDPFAQDQAHSHRRRHLVDVRPSKWTQFNSSCPGYVRPQPTSRCLCAVQLIANLPVSPRAINSQVGQLNQPARAVQLIARMLN